MDSISRNMDNQSICMIRNAQLKIWFMLYTFISMSVESSWKLLKTGIWYNTTGENMNRL